MELSGSENGNFQEQLINKKIDKIIHSQTNKDAMHQKLTGKSESLLLPTDKKRSASTNSGDNEVLLSVMSFLTMLNNLSQLA